MLSLNNKPQPPRLLLPFFMAWWETCGGEKMMQKLIREQARTTYELKQQNAGKAWKCCRLWHPTVWLGKCKYGWGVYFLQLEAKSGSIPMSVSEVSHDKASERNILYASYQEVKQYQRADVNTNQILINQKLVFCPPTVNPGVSANAPLIQMATSVPLICQQCGNCPGYTPNSMALNSQGEVNTKLPSIFICLFCFLFSRWSERILSQQPKISWCLLSTGNRPAWIRFHDHIHCVIKY